SAATQAPSGENCQPWHFVVKGSIIEQWNLPERDQSPYGWGQRASYMANGAALENLVLMAAELGYEASVRYFPNEPELVAEISLSKTGPARDPLAGAIFDRVTNRKAYTPYSLSKDEIGSLNAAVMPGTLQLTTDPIGITRLAKSGSANEEVMLSNDSLHNFFFSHLNWTKREDEEKKVGFYIETLELPPPAKIAFKFIRRRSIIRMLRKVGFHKIVGEQNANIYGMSSGIGAIAGEGGDPIHFVRSGRNLQRVWLAATRAGLSFQPLTGIIFLKLGLDRSDTVTFSDTERKTIEDAYSTIVSIFGSDRPVHFMFRIGKSEPPTAQATRFSLQESVTVN
ncbi:MAG: hypothetical protein RIQ56_598, partial [Candidatus Parcubacteria bacterium]